jgi:hypothetical protein
MYRNDLVSNNSFPVCGGDHNVLMISLENGDHIVTRPFPKEKASKFKITEVKDDLLHSLWLQKIRILGIYQDARIPHDQGVCLCQCTSNLFLKEVRKHR